MEYTNWCSGAICLVSVKTYIYTLDSSRFYRFLTFHVRSHMYVICSNLMGNTPGDFLWFYDVELLINMYIGG